MSDNLSLILLGKAAAPPLALIACGAAWLYWIKTATSIPAMLIGLGVALLTGMTVIVAGYSFPNMSAFRQSLILIGGFSLLMYAATLFLFARKTNVSKVAMVVCGFFGLIPLYYVGGYVAINAACSFGTGGC